MELAGHTSKTYDRRLDELMDLILEMGVSVHELLGMANRSLRDSSEQLVEEARVADRALNKLEQKLNESATATIALQNPVAVDLRFVTSALKMSGILERMGDLSKNAIKRSVNLSAYPEIGTRTQLEKMVSTVQQMLKDALDAVSENDAKKAIEVWKRDDEVDALYHSVFESLQKEMQDRPENVPACTHLVFIAKNFERLGDYCTSLAKMVHYIVTGEMATKALLH